MCSQFYKHLEFKSDGLELFVKNHADTYISEDFFITLDDLELLNSLNSFEEQQQFLKTILENNEYHISDIRCHKISYDNMLKPSFNYIDQIVFMPKTGITTYKHTPIPTPKKHFFLNQYQYTY